MPTFSTTLTLSLYEGRHPLPDDVQGYVFCTRHTEKLPTMSAERLEQLAFARLWGICYATGHTVPAMSDEEDGARRISLKSLRLYVTIPEGYITGFTPAFFALLNVCRNEGIAVAVTLLHYDRDTNNYWKQEVSV